MKLSPGVRDTILFVTGLGGLSLLTGVWVLTGRAPEPSLLVIFAGMAGLPAVIRGDEKRRD